MICRLNNRITECQVLCDSPNPGQGVDINITVFHSRIKRRTGKLSNSLRAQSWEEKTRGFEHRQPDAGAHTPNHYPALPPRPTLAWPQPHWSKAHRTSHFCLMFTHNSQSPSVGTLLWQLSVNRSWRFSVIGPKIPPWLGSSPFTVLNVLCWQQSRWQTDRQTDG